MCSPETGGVATATLPIPESSARGRPQASIARPEAGFRDPWIAVPLRFAAMSTAGDSTR